MTKKIFIFHIEAEKTWDSLDIDELYGFELAGKPASELEFNDVDSIEVPAFDKPDLETESIDKITLYWNGKCWWNWN